MSRVGLTDLRKPQEPSFWEVIDSYVLLPYIILAASRTLSQHLIACLNFPLDSENLFCWYKQKKVISVAAAKAAESH